MSGISVPYKDQGDVEEEVLCSHQPETLRKRCMSNDVVGVFMILIFLAFVVAVAYQSARPSRATLWKDLSTTLGRQEETWLDAILSVEPNIGPTIQYARRCIVNKRNKDATRQSVTAIDEPLLVDLQTLHLHSPRHQIPQPPCTDLELDVGSPFPPLDASHFVFGVSTQRLRLFDSMPQFSRWLSNTGAKLIVVLVDSSITTRKTAEAQMAAMGIDSTIVAADDRLGEHKRYLSLVDELYQRSVPGKTQWLVIHDDDTFFPNMPALVEHMRTEYDHELPYYIGAQSENQHAVNMYDDEAYGGAGIFISMALAEQLHQSFKACMQHGPSHGDIMIRDCIYEHTNTTLTEDDRFHQMDLDGDISGFYESGVKPLSVHHWKSPKYFERLPIASMHLISKYCGDCFLRRWRFADHVVLTNGFSVVQYPGGIDFDLDVMEETFHQGNVPTLWHGFEKLRPPLPPDQKLSYRLITAVEGGDGSIRQIYLKRGHEDEAGVKQGDDEIVELLWT